MPYGTRQFKTANQSRHHHSLTLRRIPVSSLQGLRVPIWGVKVQGQLGTLCTNRDHKVSFRTVVQTHMPNFQVMGNPSHDKSFIKRLVISTRPHAQQLCLSTTHLPCPHSGLLCRCQASRSTVRQFIAPCRTCQRLSR